MGIKDLRKRNISLLTKWWWKLEKQDGIWQKLVRGKYLYNKTIANVKRRFNDSPIWKTMLSNKDTYLAGRKVGLENDNLMRFWLDEIKMIYVNNARHCS